MAKHESIKVNNIHEKKELLYKDVVVLTYELNYPKFESSKFKESITKINKFYEIKAKKFQFYCENELYKNAILQYEGGNVYGMPNYKYEAILTYTITYNQNCSLSLYFDQYKFSGGAHGNTLRFSNSWCLIHGNQIKLHNLFSDKLYDKYILEQLKIQVEEQLKKDYGIYFPEYKKLLVDNFDEDNFYLTPNGVNIYFELYEIAPYVAGFPSFLFYYKQNGPREPKCRV